METYFQPNSPQYLDALRAFLRDVPTSPGFAEGVHLIAQAFHRYDLKENLALGINSNDVLFFGEQSITSIFGEDYRQSLSSRKFNLEPEPREEWDGAPQVPRDLRNRVDQFVVVGFAEARTAHPREKKVPKKIIFRAGVVEQEDSADRPIQGREKAAESVRVRGGQMNRRQALLLTHHLNSFHRNPRRHQPLAWRAVKGPAPNTSSREWLDELGGKGLFLRRLLGEIPDWGLGEHTLSEMAVYDSEPAASWHGEQVFAYRRPRYVLPIRFQVCFVHRDRPRGVPDETQFWVRRGSPCAAAHAMASAYLQAGFIDDGATDVLNSCLSDPFDPRTCDLWARDPSEDGAPEPIEQENQSPLAYAAGLTMREAVDVVRYLRRAGLKDVEVHAMGVGGRYLQRGFGTWDYSWTKTLLCGATLDVLGSDGLKFVGEASFELLGRYVPYEEWPQWAKEYAEDDKARGARAL